MADGDDTDVQRELRRARDALHDAKVLFEGDGTDSGVVNRLYYAAFHGAQATLYARGENPSSHGRVRQQFGQIIVLEGDADREDGRLLSTLYDYRQEADYGAGTPEVDVSRLVDRVDDFLEKMDVLAGEQ